MVDQTPDERITWRATEGTKNDGTVFFAADDLHGSTKVTLRLDYEPEGAVEKAGDLLHVVEHRVEGT